MKKITEFHRYFDDSIYWRYVREGVEIDGSGVERTKGKPITVTRIWENYGDIINRAAERYKVPCELIIATIATETSGRSNAIRLEPGYISDVKTPRKISVGLTQTLISTAQETMAMSFDRNWLLEPENSIEAGTAYISKQARWTQFDPPLVAAAYNAGSLIHQTGEKNRWKLRQYPIGTSAHCDRFIEFFNDAVFMLNQHSKKPSVSMNKILGNVTPVSRKMEVKKKSKKLSINYGKSVKKELHPYVIKVLSEIMQKADINTATVTSTFRTPADQARVMFHNIETKGVKSQKDLYGYYGDQVIDVYVKSKNEGKSPTDIKADMEQKIKEIGPSKVSKHCADGISLNVFDVAPSSIKNKVAFEKAIIADSRISDYILPSKREPAYHLEIPIKSEN